MLSPTNDQTIIVTGVSGGIGAATAHLLLKNGYAVIGLDRESGYDEAFPASRYRHFVADITDEDSVRETCTQIQRQAQDELQASAAPSHAILVAGGALPDEIADDDDNPLSLSLSLDVFRSSVDINLCAQYICIKHFVPLLESAGSSAEKSAVVNRSITLVSSINSMGDFGYPAYSAAKAGLAGLTKSLAIPLGRLNIRINAIAFGTVLTASVKELHAANEHHFSQMRSLAALKSGFSSVDEAAQVLVSITQLSSVTGQIITADWGQAVPGNHTR
jgi:NAD(P)-dependent dehydrogenase (short-subunit alcohol dehydrogenase family)